MKVRISLYWLILILVIFPPWSIDLPDFKSFVGHSWFWSPPLIGYRVSIDFKILVIEAIGLFLLIYFFKKLRCFLRSY